MEGWWIGAAENGIIGAAFLTIGTILAVRLTRTRQWQSNTIASLFTLVALTCGAGHAFRATLALGPEVGLFGAAGIAAQIELADWHMWIADLATGFAGVFYLVARFKHRDILETARLFEDARSRQTRAIEVHDGVVQRLAEAKLALEAGHRERARETLHEGLEASKAIISEVEGVGTPGTLRRPRDPTIHTEGDR